MKLTAKQTYDKIVKYFNSKYDNSLPDMSQYSKAERMAFGPHIRRIMYFTLQQREDGQYFVISYNSLSLRGKDVENILKKFKLTNIRSVAAGARGAYPSYMGKIKEDDAK